MRIPLVSKSIALIIVYLVASQCPLKAQEPRSSFWAVVFTAVTFLTLQYIFEHPTTPTNEEEIDGEEEDQSDFPIESLVLFTSIFGA